MQENKNNKKVGVGSVKARNTNILKGPWNNYPEGAVEFGNQSISTAKYFSNRNFQTAPMRKMRGVKFNAYKNKNMYLYFRPNYKFQT